jgi:hypothetical protein
VAWREREGEISAGAAAQLVDDAGGRGTETGLEGDREGRGRSSAGGGGCGCWREELRPR